MNINTELENINGFITYVKACKTDLTAALEAKGVVVPPEDILGTFASKVTSIVASTDIESLEISQAAFDALLVKDLTTVYICKQ